MSKIIYRIKQAIDFKGIGVREFCNTIDVSHSFLTKEREIGNEKVSKIIDALPGIDPMWLLTGKGNMIQSENNLSTTNTLMWVRAGIPLLPLDVLNHMGSKDISKLEYDYEYFVIPTFKEAEFLTSVRGNSMTPKYNSGDIIACQRLPLDTFFQWNKVYVLGTEQGALIKRIKKSPIEGHISVVSDNQDYEPFDLAVNRIHVLAIILGIIRAE